MEKKDRWHTRISVPVSGTGVEEDFIPMADADKEVKRLEDRMKDLENCRAYWAKCDECPIHKDCSLMYEVAKADKKPHNLPMTKDQAIELEWQRTH